MFWWWWFIFLVYLHMSFDVTDLLSGSKSPVVPSPPPPSANSFSHQSVFSTSANSTFQDKPQQLSYDFSSVQKNTIGPMLNALFQNSSHDRSHRSSKSGRLVCLCCSYLSSSIVQVLRTWIVLYHLLSAGTICINDNPDYFVSMTALTILYHWLQ